MAFAKLTLKPGVLAVASQLAAEGTLRVSRCVRFFLGFLQKVGGWTRLTSTLFVGTCRGLHGWFDLSGNPYLAVGTEQRLEVLEGGALFDITPLRTTSNPAPSFTTQSGLIAVTVTDAANGAVAGDWINLIVPVSVGGLVLQGFYLVQSVTDANNYVINAASAATANVSNGGAVPSFTTTNTSPNVEVTLNNHGLVAGSLFAVGVATIFGGVTIAVGVITCLPVPLRPPTHSTLPRVGRPLSARPFPRTAAMPGSRTSSTAVSPSTRRSSATASAIMAPAITGSVVAAASACKSCCAGRSIIGANCCWPAPPMARSIPGPRPLRPRRLLWRRPRNFRGGYSSSASCRSWLSLGAEAGGTQFPKISSAGLIPGITPPSRPASATRPAVSRFRRGRTSWPASRSGLVP